MVIRSLVRGMTVLTGSAVLALSGVATATSAVAAPPRPTAWEFYGCTAVQESARKSAKTLSGRAITAYTSAVAPTAAAGAFTWTSIRFQLPGDLLVLLRNLT